MDVLTMERSTVLSLLPYKKNGPTRMACRGYFEPMNLDAALTPAMAYIFSATIPGITRGPHETRRPNGFFGFIGPSTFKVYLLGCT